MNRINKEYNGNIITFQYIGDRIKKENHKKYSITYLYEDDILYGFNYDSRNYFFIFDENNTVTNIYNQENEVIVNYIYDEYGKVKQINELVDGNWENTTNTILSIGNINKIRLFSYYFDDETELYYGNKRFYDSKNKEFVNSINIKNLKQIDYYNENTYKPLSINEINTISTLANTADPVIIAGYGRQITDWANRLCSSNSYGVAIASKTGWYNSLSTVEILARLIYGEHTTSTVEHKAISWVLLNRLYAKSSMYGYTLREIATKPSQFSTISGTGSLHARQPNTKIDGWYNATWMACAIMTTTDDIYCKALFGRPAGITTQKYFRGMSNFLANTQNSTEGIDCIEFISNSKRLKNVIVVDLVNMNTPLVYYGYRKSDFNDISGLHNVFFDYE